MVMRPANVAAADLMDLVEQFKLGVTSIGDLAAIWLEGWSEHRLLVILPFGFGGCRNDPLGSAPQDFKEAAHPLAIHRRELMTKVVEIGRISRRSTAAKVAAICFSGSGAKILTDSDSESSDARPMPNIS